MNNYVTLNNLITYLKELQNEGKGEYNIYIGYSQMDDSQLLYNDNEKVIRFE